MFRVTWSKIRNQSKLFLGAGIGLTAASLWYQRTYPPKISFASSQETAQALAEIKRVVGTVNFSTNRAELEQQADSEWQTRHRLPNELASAIVRPQSTEEVARILKIANGYKLPVVAVSGQTSLEGHFTPVNGGIALDMSLMNRVLKLNEEDLDVVVQPGIGWEELRDELAPKGLMFGTDAGPGAQIGGMCACCSSGIGAFRYGPMRHNVISVTVVLADGRVIKTRRRPRKTSAGYSLTDLFVGSEGTLGIVTELTLKLCPAANLQRVGILTFNSLKDATNTVQQLLLKSGLQLDALEYMDDVQMKIINESNLTARKFSEKHSLLLRFAGSSEQSIENEIKVVEECARLNNLHSVTFSRNKDESDELWEARKNALWSMMNYARPKKMWTTDVAVPISKLSTIITESQEMLKDAGLQASIIGHVGDGNFHALIAYDESELVKATEVVHKMVERAIELDGTCTGEHGIGVGKREFLELELGEETVGVMRDLKSCLDPNFILNPGKVFTIN